jgi:hypothetical protein
MAAKKKSKGSPAKATVSVAPCVGEYHADRARGIVILTARGSHPTSGYIVRFERVAAKTFTVRLVHIVPAGPVLDVVTPFAVSQAFNDANSSTVTVIDARGKQTVTIETHTADDAPSRIFPTALLADAGPTGTSCRACVRGVIEGWGGSTILDWNTKLNDLYLRGACDASAISDLLDRLAAQGCGQPLPGGVSCQTTALQVRDAIC